MDGDGSGAAVFVAFGGTAAASFSAPKASEAVISSVHKPDSTGLLLFIGSAPVGQDFIELRLAAGGGVAWISGMALCRHSKSPSQLTKAALACND
jgi:hypothetical protein